MKHFFRKGCYSSTLFLKHYLLPAIAGSLIFNSQEVHGQTWNNRLTSYSEIVLASLPEGYGSGEGIRNSKANGENNYGVQLFTNRQPRFVIDINGKAALGENVYNYVPQARLDVNGDAIFRNGNDMNVFTKDQLLFGWSNSGYRHAIKTRHSAGNAAGNAIDFCLWKYGADAVLGSPSLKVMTLQGDGNVGIGTTNPTEKLEVAGNILAKPNGPTGVQIHIGQSDPSADAWIGTVSNHSLYLCTNSAAGACLKLTNSKKIVLLADNVGIGSGTVPYRLGIKQNEQITDDSSGAKRGLAFINNGTDHAYYMGYNRGAKFGIGFHDGASTYRNLMTLDQVGLMTVTLNKTDGWNVISSFFQPNIPDNGTVLIELGKSSTNKNTGHIFYTHVADGSDNNALSFGHWGNDRLLNIVAGGKVGIGTMTPTSKFHVVSTGRRTSAGSSITFDGNGMLPWIQSSLRLTNTAESTSTEYAGYFGVNTFGPDLQNQKYPFLNIESSSDNMPIIMEVHNKATMEIFQHQVLIGSNLPLPASDAVVPYSGLNYTLGVRGTIVSSGITCKDLTAWADYVFDEQYKLKPLTEVADFVNKNKHLPDVPSQKELLEKGVDLVDMLRVHMQKIEELTLYSIEQQKLLKEQQNILAKQQQQIGQLQKQLSEKSAAGKKVALR